LRRRTPLSFLMGDLDHFKRINDRYGHTAGDAVLREVAERVRSCVRDTDFAARFGGEEIVVIAPACDDQGARLIAERLRAGVCARPIRQGESSMIVTMSIGLATSDDTYRPTNVATLVERADAALYNAKAAGRNQVCAWRDRLTSAGTERGGGPVLLALPKRSPEPS
ncbi:MAG: GGDEF domain-containing protein, partial [Planctomycetota bacterium]|nr:GGDEF domain-containing protein [Planctomycetota bacterium]